MTNEKITVMAKHCHLIPVLVICVGWRAGPRACFWSFITLANASLITVDVPLGAVGGCLVPFLGPVTTIVVINS